MMRNACVSGGAKLKCTCAEAGVECETIDHGDGSYELMWRSVMSGIFVVGVEIGKESIMGPALSVQFLSATPDMAKTVAEGDGLHEARAGTPAIVRLQLLDEYGNVALYAACTARPNQPE
jgi:hypothetical protein